MKYETHHGIDVRAGAIAATASEVYIDGDTSWAYNFAVNGGE